MRHQDGTDLGQLLRIHGPLSVAGTCETVRQAALGLAAMHERHIIHRDIKPSNLLLTQDGVVKSIDFGLSRNLHKPHDDVPASSCIPGTRAYIAPELLSLHQPDPCSDLYGLGVTLLALSTGNDPPLAQLEGLSQADLAAASEVLGVGETPIPLGLARVIGRAIPTDHTRRYRTADEFVVDLEPFCEGSDLVALPSRTTPQSSPPVSIR